MLCDYLFCTSSSCSHYLYISYPGDVSCFIGRSNRLSGSCVPKFFEYRQPVISYANVLTLITISGQDKKISVGSSLLCSLGDNTEHVEESC